MSETRAKRAASQRTLTFGLMTVAALLVLSVFVASPTNAATITVNSTNDLGSGGCNPIECTLREAIDASNAASTVNDTIEFDIPVPDARWNASGVCTITPTTQLPSITDRATIDGYTQTGASKNTSTTNTNNAVLKVEISGAATAGGVTLTPGLTVNGFGASGTVIRGLVINRFSLHGVFVDAGAVATVEGNFIGTDTNGTSGLGNRGFGVRVEAPGNIIGGTAPGADNVISDNSGSGGVINGSNATNNSIQGNFIGTNAAGDADLGNANDGVFVEGSDNTVGGRQTKQATASPSTARTECRSPASSETAWETASFRTPCSSTTGSA